MRFVRRNRRFAIFRVGYARRFLEALSSGILASLRPPAQLSITTLTPTYTRTACSIYCLLLPPPTLSLTLLHCALSALRCSRTRFTTPPSRAHVLFSCGASTPPLIPTSATFPYMATATFHLTALLSFPLSLLHPHSLHWLPHLQRPISASASLRSCRITLPHTLSLIYLATAPLSHRSRSAFLSPPSSRLPTLCYTFLQLFYLPPTFLRPLSHFALSSFTIFCSFLLLLPRFSCLQAVYSHPHLLHHFFISPILSPISLIHFLSPPTSYHSICYAIPSSTLTPPIHTTHPHQFPLRYLSLTVIAITLHVILRVALSAPTTARSFLTQPLSHLYHCPFAVFCFVRSLRS